MLDKFAKERKISQLTAHSSQLTATRNFLFAATYTTQPLTTGINDSHAEGVLHSLGYAWLLFAYTFSRRRDTIS